MRGREARSRGGLVKGAAQMSVAPPGGQNRIMIYGPKDDGTYIELPQCRRPCRAITHTPG